MDVIQFRNKLRVIGTTTMAVLTIGAPAAFAAIDVSGTNDTTGPNSENENVYEIDHAVDLDVENIATVDNDVEVDVETGDNEVASNTTVEDISTGDVEVEGSFDTESNSGSINLGNLLSGASVSADFTNDTTGPRSENSNTLEVDHDIDVDYTNTARVNNDLDFNASTGGNTVRTNTTVGDVTGGDVEASFDFSSELNSGASSINWGSLGGGSVNADFTNDTTGPNSSNTNTVEVDSDVDVDVTNTATINNDLDVDVSTGGNTTRNNTTVGDVSTGSVRINFSANNTAN